MNTSLIRSNVERYISLNSRQKKVFEDLLLQEHYGRKFYILNQNQPCNDICFVNSGILRAFHMSPDGKESTLMFATKDWWITDMHSFLNELPAMVSIQVVKNSSILKLSKKNLDQLYVEIPQFNQFFRILMQNAYCREQLRTIQNLSLSSKERYERFIQKYPQIANNVPLKQIASYLGITPEFLSAIRSEQN